MRALAMFTASALLAAAAQLAVSSCQNEYDECGTGVFPPMPESRPPFNITAVHDVTEQGSEDGPALEGTMEITGGELIIRYKLEGEDREVAYDIVPDKKF